jgi:serine/threonine protein kinase
MNLFSHNHLSNQLFLSSSYPCSILLSVNGIAKISDFGIAHIFDEERKSFLQTPYSKDFDAIDEFLSDEEDGISNKRDATVDEAESPTHLSKRESEEAINMSSKHSSGLLQKTEGTLFFYSPEMCASEKSVFSGYSADLWAAGVCLHTFITGKLPFFSLNPGELFDMILSKEVEYDTLDLSNNSKSLLQKLLVKDPSLRAGVGDCLKHDFLKDARAQRIRQLGKEFEQSTRDIVLTDTDINLALSITLRSSVFPKPTQKQSSGSTETKRTHSKIVNKSMPDLQLNRSPSTAERVAQRPTRSPFLKGLFKNGYFGKKK